MNMFEKTLNANPLFFAFFLPAVTDGIVTLIGQSSEYWKKGVVNEASPAYYFLLASPWLFLFGSVCWFLIWYWIVKKLKEPFNFFLMFVFISGHSWGSSSWIAKFFREHGLFTLDNILLTNLSWGILVVYFILIAGIATHCLQLYLQKFRLKSNSKMN